MGTLRRSHRAVGTYHWPPSTTCAPGRRCITAPIAYIRGVDGGPTGRLGYKSAFWAYRDGPVESARKRRFAETGAACAEATLRSIGRDWALRWAATTVNPTRSREETGPLPR